MQALVEIIEYYELHSLAPSTGNLTKRHRSGVPPADNAAVRANFVADLDAGSALSCVMEVNRRDRAQYTLRVYEDIKRFCCL
jgi:hypothetical protein